MPQVNKIKEFSTINMKLVINKINENITHDSTKYKTDMDVLDKNLKIIYNN